MAIKWDLGKLNSAQVAWDNLCVTLVKLGFKRVVVDFNTTYQRGRVHLQADPCGPGVYVDNVYIGGIDDVTGLVDLLVEQIV